MSEGIKPADGAQSDLPLPAPAAKAMPLDQVQSMNDDEVLDFTRRIRVRHINHTLDSNNGLLPADLDEQKVLLSALKDLDTQAGRNKLVGAKEKASAADREATAAVLQMMKMLGDDPMRRKPIEGQTGEPRPIPSIKDAPNLAPLDIRPDETRVGVDSRTYEEFSNES